ncbi:hypothetical protein E4U55_000972 [Claviceps digitariae]|nr:hypothetical protein E4U55_000972 [Claviceps digitariae]
MAHLLSEHPTLGIHLSNKKLVPVITSSSTPTNLTVLASLSAGALLARKAAQRARLGDLQRIVVEYPDAGPVVLETFLEPPEVAGAAETTPAEEEARLRLRLQRLRLQQLQQQQQQRLLQIQRQRQQQLLLLQQKKMKKKKKGQEQEQPREEEQQQAQQTNQQQAQQQKPEEEEEEEDENATPLLVGVVVAPSPDDVAEAADVLVDVEDLGRELQDAWAAEPETDPTFGLTPTE